MNKTSFSCRFVNIAARSPGRSIAGPLVVRILTPSSLAIILDNVVLPSPGGRTAEHDQAAPYASWPLLYIFSNFPSLALDRYIPPNNEDAGCTPPLGLPSSDCAVTIRLSSIVPASSPALSLILGTIAAALALSSTSGDSSPVTLSFTHAKPCPTPHPDIPRPISASRAAATSNCYPPAAGEIQARSCDATANRPSIAPSLSFRSRTIRCAVFFRFPAASSRT